MSTADVLKATGFWLIAVCVVVSVWFFGAWEKWWFWFFCSFIFLGFILCMFAFTVDKDIPSLSFSSILFVIFILYSLVRILFGCVIEDAERSILLFFIPYGIGLSFRRYLNRSDSLRWNIFNFLLLNIALMALYGIINEILFHSKYVMWVAGYEQYEGRAKGAFFCPDHFSMLLEIGVCMSLGILLTKGIPFKFRFFSFLILVVCTAGVIFSKSRGGILTLIVVFLFLSVAGLKSWEKKERLFLRIFLAGFVLSTFLITFHFKSDTVERFISYFAVLEGDKESTVWYMRWFEKIKRDCRPRMYAGAFRAWTGSKMNMFFGIGPGMHQHVWPHFGASGDGDKEEYKWPSVLNLDLHSYEVHSDWLQLLEEYGLIGFVLFLLAFLALYRRLLSINFRLAEAVKESSLSKSMDYAVNLGTILVLTAAAFHSLGDFPLQIPAIGWYLGAILGIGLGVKII